MFSDRVPKVLAIAVLALLLSAGPSVATPASAGDGSGLPSLEHSLFGDALAGFQDLLARLAERFGLGPDDTRSVDKDDPPPGSGSGGGSGGGTGGSWEPSGRP